jgi:hypothetical protein
MDRARDPDLAARLFGARPEHALALLRAAWPVAVGPDVARRTEVVALDRGILRVKVPDAGWQRSLQRMRGQILSRLREVAGGGTPRGLGFVTGPVITVPETAAPSPSAAGSPTPPKAVLEAAGAIPDADLRARYLATAARYLARRPRDQEEEGAGPSSATG